MWTLVLVALVATGATAAIIQPLQHPKCTLPGTQTNVRVHRAHCRVCRRVKHAEGAAGLTFTHTNADNLHDATTATKILWQKLQENAVRDIVTLRVRRADDRVRQFCVSVPRTQPMLQNGRLECKFGPGVMEVSADVVAIGDNHKLESSHSKRSVKPDTRQRCYDWKPTTLSLSPHRLNSSMTVSWDPPFRASGLRVELVNKNDDKHSKSKEWRSYETRDHVYTNFKFNNVSSGRYTVQIKPLSCRDCHDFEENGCHSDPVESDVVVFVAGASQTEIVEPVPTVNKTVTINPEEKMPQFVLIGVTSFAVICVAVMATICYNRERLFGCKTLTDGRETTHWYPVLGGNRDPSIVLLYGSDDRRHIDAVCSFAKLLRKTVRAEVILDREQPCQDLRNINEWIQKTIRPPNIVVIVASEGLWELINSQHELELDIHNQIADFYTQMNVPALTHLRDVCNCGLKIFLVSFGYGHSSMDRLAKMTPMFEAVAEQYEVTSKAGTRPPQERYPGLEALVAELKRLTSDTSGNVPIADIPEANTFFAKARWMADVIKRHNDERTWMNRDCQSYSGSSSTVSLDESLRTNYTHRWNVVSVDDAECQERLLTGHEMTPAILAASRNFHESSSKLPVVSEIESVL